MLPSAGAVNLSSFILGSKIRNFGTHGGFGVASWDSKLLWKRLGDVMREMDFSLFFLWR